MDRVPGEAVCMKPELAVVARRQDGVVTRQQGIAAGYSVDQIDRLLTRGALTVIRPGLYRSPSAPVTWRSQAWAVLLAAGPLAVLSHGVAARVRQLDGVPAYDAFEITVPSRRRPRSVGNATVHRLSLPGHCRVTVAGLPVTSPERTIVDLACQLPTEAAMRILTDGLRSGVVQSRRLDECLARAAGRTGVERARNAVRLADPRIESVLEHELLGIIRGIGIAVVPQCEVRHGGEFVARLDFAVPALRLGIEADGYASHSRRGQFERDHERRAALRVAGWELLSFTANQIRQRPDRVATIVTATVAGLRSAGGLPAA